MVTGGTQNRPGGWTNQNLLSLLLGQPSAVLWSNLSSEFIDQSWGQVSYLSTLPSSEHPCLVSSCPSRPVDAAPLQVSNLHLIRRDVVQFGDTEWEGIVIDPGRST